MKSMRFRCRAGLAWLCAVALLVPLLLTCVPMLSVAAEGEGQVLYLGDHPELVTSFAALEDTVGYNKAHSGDVITIGKTTFTRGLGLHCLPDRRAYVEMDISGCQATYFAASVGMQSKSADGVFLDWGSASFHVYGDGVLLASSPVMKYGEEPYFLTCRVEGVQTLRLEMDNEGSYACDWCEWGDARLTENQPAEETEKEKPMEEITQSPEVTAGDFAYISDLYWSDARTLAGNEVMRDANTANEEIWTADGRFFEKGVGMHASSGDWTSYVEVNIEGLGYTVFATYYGICETLSVYDISMANVKFAVFADGKALFTSENMHYGEPMAYVQCDIAGVKTLRLAIASEGGAISGGWGTWGGAVLSKSGQVEALFREEEATMPETVPDTGTEVAGTVTEPVTEPETVTEPATESEAVTEPATESEAVTEPEPATSVGAPTDPPAETPAQPPVDTGETTGSAGGCRSGVTGHAGLWAVVALGFAALGLSLAARMRRGERGRHA